MTGLTEYSRRHSTYMDCIFPEERPKNTLGEWVASHGLRQFRTAETEKYPHVTFFFNGGKETPEPGEERCLVPCEAVDSGLGRVLEALETAGGAMIVTADHGNCEMMIDPATGKPHTAHTLNPVPVILVGGPEGARLRPGRLADLAPTMLELMNLPKPPEMTGTSLLS